MTCERRPPAPRCHDCPGGEACAAKQGAAISVADAELARRRAAGEPVELWGTTAADFGHPLAEYEGCEGLGAEVLTPEDLAAPDLGVGPPNVGCRQCARGTDHDLADCDDSKALAAWAPAAVPEPWACGACGSTTGAVLYERGPLAGLRRCWPCARPALEGTP